MAGVGDHAAIVEGVPDAVVVVVAVAGVASAIAVVIELIAIGEQGAVVDLVENSVGIVVGIASVAVAVAIAVELPTASPSVFSWLVLANCTQLSQTSPATS